MNIQGSRAAFLTLAVRMARTMALVLGLGAASLGAAPSTACASRGVTGALAPVTKYGKELVPFAMVAKTGDYSRRMFIDATSSRRFAQTGHLPEGAVLVLETWFGRELSTVYVRQRVGDGFRASSFPPTAPNFATTSDAVCEGCHSRAHATEDTFTLPLLRKALERGAVQAIVCPKPSFTPCDLSVYEGP